MRTVRQGFAFTTAVMVPDCPRTCSASKASNLTIVVTVSLYPVSAWDTDAFSATLSPWLLGLS
jgi:hypothetical protein